ncbi:MAG: NADH:ubiquinone oxidoreductase [Chloroflexi bacterium]|nr:NADH:ubiquinone oxidoreductase [Chloroflexota bacterium]MCL5950877.1 NADH:ubiquinone oxidoreductase [Chloroflexota bacterium]
MRPKVAFFDFTSCEGCQLTVVDSLQTHLDLLDAVEIVRFREAISDRGEDYAIAFVEGSITRPSDAERLKGIRAQAAVLVALGACAHLGGINAIKNLSPFEQARRYVYGDHGEWYPTYETRPLSAVVKVDAFIPGCPIDREEFVQVVQALLLGKKPSIPDYPMCVTCKMKENVCLFDKGGVCLGPLTRAGCGAICPSYGVGCEGCRGVISNPNRDAMEDVLAEHGLTPDALFARMTLFGAYEMGK